VQSTKWLPAPETLVQLVAQLEQRIETIEKELREDEETKLQHLARQIRLLGKEPNDYLDPQVAR
jgi:hypothetical protein